MNGLSSCDDAVERLAAVLSGVLATGSSGLSDREAHRQARRGATAILPAVQAMHRIQDRLWDCRGETAWEGLVHRRCRMSPSSPTGGAAAPGPAAAEGVSIRQVERAGWELIQATVEAPVEGQYWRVTHELARRTSPSGADAVENGTLTAPGAGFDTPSGCVFYRLTDSDVGSWAQASGDRNPIHLLPGRAAAAGLSAGSHEVVAHGLLLGAISLALVQSSPLRQIGLVFIDSADVPVSQCGTGKPWATLTVDPASGDIIQGRRPVLRRR
ncbi:MaoC/PaaZ C-terminal domain-containing protein [uncultured Actinomyces sp.]|uniref:MaoC/PaaZ C-terminal domain-containing protein n=1 Tax=uncultured Actinomyces sp. TaxID=249061 RepID=UPI002805D418|nr:MaoC/PaaZ C-terminal domain-containing protein [uncultured Actinomyces sp.]